MKSEGRCLPCSPSTALESAAGIDKDESTSNLGPLIHLKLTVDTKPQEASNNTPGEQEEYAFEVQPDKLDVLVHELGLAKALMSSSM